MPVSFNTSTTRSELQIRKKQIELTRQGYDLLDKKRMALLKELMRLEVDVVEKAEILQETATLAHQSLAYSAAKFSRATLRSAAIGRHKEVSLVMETHMIMGVTLPYIKSYNLIKPGLESSIISMNQSPTIEETAASFEAEVIAILHLVEGEMQFTRLLEEIRTTTRRLKAIENILLPRLEAERNYIRMALEERERSDHNRLKIAKDNLGTKHSPIQSK
jgi:V/A-type H+/Na+-transporting ATPase subunit D